MKPNINYFYYQTPAGCIKINITEEGIQEAYFSNEEKIQKQQNVNVSKLKPIGTNFQIKVWQETLKIPCGETKTYQEIATLIGHPKSYRAVANALAKNKIAYFIPCHRVIRKNGQLGGYKWGIEKKINLLKSEGAIE